MDSLSPLLPSFPMSSHAMRTEKSKGSRTLEGHRMFLCARPWAGCFHTVPLQDVGSVGPGLVCSRRSMSSICICQSNNIITIINIIIGC